MKKKLLTILICGALILGITGCNEKNKKDEEILDTNSEECCENCMCGDTISLLKKTETAWTLTKINNEGEYEYINDGFINFHGTGENRFAFYHNDKEIKGDFIINKENELILTPSDSNEKITCKLGEEKYLIAVLNCDNNFGTFTLQKHGTIELPSIIKDTASKTKSIKVKYHEEGKNEKIIKDEDLNTILSIINNSKVWTGAVTLPSPKYNLELLDNNNRVIAKVEYNPGHYFDIEIDGKSFNLTKMDRDLLNSILDK